jgi:cobalt/nickel transport system permease protein
MRLGNYIEAGKMDELGRMDSPMHQVDARAKILTTAAFLVVVMSFGRYEVAALTPLFLFPFALAAKGNIPWGYLLRKIALAAPFAVFVGVFNPLLDREAMGRLGPWTIAAGWFSFASILLRFALTESAGLILVATTGIHRLCAGLVALGLPQVFVVQLLFLHRYFFVIGDEGRRMLLSVEMRSEGASRLSLRTYGTLLGHLLLRSMDRAQRIYRAMVSRGFEGEVRLLRPRPLCWSDAAFVVAWGAFFLLARRWNLAHVVEKMHAGGGL